MKRSIAGIARRKADKLARGHRTADEDRAHPRPRAALPHAALARFVDDVRRSKTDQPGAGFAKADPARSRPKCLRGAYAARLAHRGGPHERAPALSHVHDEREAASATYRRRGRGRGSSDALTQAHCVDGDLPRALVARRLCHERGQGPAHDSRDSQITGHRDPKTVDGYIPARDPDPIRGRRRRLTARLETARS